MRERTERYLRDYERAMMNLKAVLDRAKEETDDIIIDAAIKRFELVYELAWKLLKELLADMGIFVKNPRGCFKESFINDLIEDESVWLNMIEDRNILVHTYTHEISRNVFNHIAETYSQTFMALMEKAKRLSEEEK